MVDCHAFELHSRLHAALLLLGYVPSFVGQVLFLARCQVNVTALRVSVRLELSGAARVVMHLHVVERMTRQGFDASFQVVGQPRIVARGQAGCLLALRNLAGAIRDGLLKLLRS